MATRTGTTSTALATSLRNVYTNPLLAAIQVGAVVEAYHLNLIADFIISNIGVHTHTLTEFTRIDEFGNTGSTLSNARTTSAPDIGSVSFPATQGATITAASYNQLAADVNDARVHRHTFSDDIP